MERAGQSNSNLWFTSAALPDSLGPATADGAVWLNEDIDAGEESEPFLFSGWDVRACWIKNEGSGDATFTFKTDIQGNNEWSILRSMKVKSGEAINFLFAGSEQGEWIKVSSDRSTKATVYFIYTSKDDRPDYPDTIFEGLSVVSESSSVAGLLWGTGNNRRTLGILAGISDNELFAESGYYELNADLKLMKVDDTVTASRMRNRMQIPENVITADEASVLITDDRGRRWRLPMGDRKYDTLTEKALLRICREVVTERDILSCSGTFYELPAENADGFARIRPIASHNFRISDFTSYRGMLVMTGITTSGGTSNEHIIRSDDGKAAVWAGVIDDLWKLGKPVGEGGPWKDAAVRGGEPSDPYLIGFYDERRLTLKHNSDKPVTFTIEADPSGSGQWMKYMEIEAEPGKEFKMLFPDHFQARWIRFRAGSDCTATAWLSYR